MNKTEVKYPEVHVDLIGQDGNIFDILGRVSFAMRQANIPKDEINLWIKEAMEKKNYDECLCFIMDSVTTD